ECSLAAHPRAGHVANVARASLRGLDMSDFKTGYGPWALVAGASTGMGAEFATQPAKRGLHLVLVARRAELLDEVARVVRSCGVEARTVAADLADANLLEKLRPATQDVEIGLLVYNAAHSLIGRFLDQPLQDKLRIIDVNCRGPVLLADAYGRLMAQRGRG